jgi:putative drug exporter of the RND superfamily
VTWLAHFVLRRRRLLIAAWIVLTLFGGFSAKQVSSRWLEQFSIPGYSAYEANQRALKTFGTGEQAPLVAVFQAKGDVTKVPGIPAAIAATAKKNPGSRVSSYFSTGSSAYVSRDRHTTFAELYPRGNQGFNGGVNIKGARAALKQAAPPGTKVYLTGRDPLQEAQGGGSGPSVLTEFLIGGLGALVILVFVFGTLPAVAMPIAVAISSILTTFSLIWALTYLTPVSLIVQFLVALVGLGVAIDYSLLMIFRFREELSHDADVDTALVETMRHAGRSVIVSGSTVAIGLVSMVLLPVPVIRSIGIGGMLIPAVSVITSITLLPALLATLGHRINRVRLLPGRITGVGRTGSGFWRRWAEFVGRHPIPVALAGLAIVGLLLVPGLQLNPAEAQAKDQPGSGDAVQGREALARAGISAGVMKPYVILVEHNASPNTLDTLVSRLESTPGIAGAAAPPEWQKGDSALVEAFLSKDPATSLGPKTIDRLQHDVLPAFERSVDSGVQATLGGIAPEDHDFVRAVYGKFAYVLAFVILLTFVLLMRAFRSLILPLKAVILNLVSLGAAYGIIVLIFQWGHGSQTIWHVHGTGAIISWIPLMIFAFLYGLSMDYEVFMLTRMREAYDETGDTRQAVVTGLARTGKLVTSAALVLMFAFFVLSVGPGVDIKQFGIGLAAGIILDATVIRTLLVPSLVLLLGRWNWWLPSPLARILRVPPSPIRAAGAGARAR